MSQSRSYKYYLTAPTRWFVSSGVGATCASAVHWCIDTFASFTGPAREYLYDVSYGVTGLTFLVTTKIAKKRMDESNAITAKLEIEIKSTLHEHQSLKNRLISLNEQVTFDKDQIKEVVNAKALFAERERISTYVEAVFKEIKDDTPSLNYERKEDTPINYATKLTRWPVSFGFGAGLSYSVNYCGNLIATYSRAAGHTLLGIVSTNYVLTVFTLVYTTLLANRKFKTDILHIKKCGDDVTRLIEENKLISEAIAHTHNKLKYHRDAVYALEIPLDERVVTIHTQPIQPLIRKETKSEFAIEIHEVQSEEKKGCCARTREAVKYYFKTPYNVVANVVTSASFASGVYYCGDIAVTLVSGFNPAVVYTVKGINWFLTGVNFIATTKFAFTDMNLSIHRINGLQKAFIAAQEEQNRLMSKIEDLEDRLEAQQIILRQENRKQQENVYHGHETLDLLDDWKGPLHYGHDPKPPREVELTIVKMLRMDSDSWVRVRPDIASEPNTPREEKSQTPLQARGFWNRFMQPKQADLNEQLLPGRKR